MKGWMIKRKGGDYLQVGDGGLVDWVPIIYGTPFLVEWVAEDYCTNHIKGTECKVVRVEVKEIRQ